MADFFEIDFMQLDAKSSADAIPVRYELNGVTRIHLTDGGFQSSGDDVVEYINKYYDKPTKIDAVIVTHPDGDHAGGLRTVLDEFEIGALWMLRPWDYVDELIDRFSRFSNKDNLAKRLKEIYPNIAALEEIALENNIPIFDPFQGAGIGDFTVMAPSKERYLDLIVESEKTPESSKQEARESFGAAATLLEKAISFIKALWGDENFPEDETSPENEMSIIQYANLCDKRTLLTGDAGRGTLQEAADYAPHIGLSLPGIDNFQTPHHGSRRNLSTEILDQWIGPRLANKPEEGAEKFRAVISASKEDGDHPRKTVVRALIHRGAKVLTTEEASKRVGQNAPDREGWVAATGAPYPEDQEE